MLNLRKIISYILIDSVFNNTFIKDMEQFLVESMLSLGNNSAFFWQPKVLACTFVVT